MSQDYRRFLITATAVLGCITAGLLGWELYDGYTDRSGWEETESGRYYADFHGEQVSGWQEIDGQRYYFGLNRQMHTGWLQSGSDRFYFDDTGLLHTGWLETEEGRYYFDQDGCLCTGRVDTPEGTFLLDSDGRMRTGWVEFDGQLHYVLENGQLHTGWLESESGKYYLDENGTPVTGWQTIEGVTCFFSEEGTLYSGWLQQGEYRYYLLPDGKMAVGPTQIDGRTYYFTPKGIHVVLVNRDHPVPEDYDAEIVPFTDVFYIAADCKDALAEMLADCSDAGYPYLLNSTYRTLEEQWWILNKRTSEYQAAGHSRAEAYALTLMSVAYPGTSEHHLGLAVDIEREGALNWLRQHCWEYGFIIRYPEGKTHITGIMYEPWHFRYVGVEVSMDMKDSGLCLEEYLGAYVPEDQAEG